MPERHAAFLRATLRCLPDSLKILKQQLPAYIERGLEIRPIEIGPQNLGQIAAAVAAAGGAILDHDALRDAGRFVDLFRQGLAFDQILILHDTGIFRDHGHGERIPFGDLVTLLDLALGRGFLDRNDDGVTDTGLLPGAARHRADAEVLPAPQGDRKSVV